MDVRSELLLLQLNIANLATAFLEWEEEEEKNKRNRSQWVNPYLRERNEKGRYAQDFENMVQNPEMFYENFHMSHMCFGELFNILERHLVPKRKSRPDCIPPQTKLAIVLEYLASGDIQRHVTSVYRISKASMCGLIYTVRDAVYTELKKEIPLWTVEAMRQYAEEFERVWNFPNCIGAIAGKHVAIKAPFKSGSLFYNYKGFHSIVLLAVCDASYRFTFIDIGAYGSEGDVNVFSNTKFGQDILNEKLDFPVNGDVGGTKLPYYLLGDDAFPLCKRIMKPYSGKNVDKDQRICNYRLSRARRCIENSFGILSWKWMCLQRTILSKPESAQKIVFGLHCAR